MQIPLEVQIDAVSALRSDLLRAADTLEDGRFSGIGGSMPEFGSFDNRAMLEDQHQLAHGLVLATVKSQIKSLDSFYDALVDLQRELGAVDDQSASHSINLALAVHRLDSASSPDGADEAGRNYRDRHPEG